MIALCIPSRCAERAQVSESRRHPCQSRGGSRVRVRAQRSAPGRHARPGPGARTRAARVGPAAARGPGRVFPIRVGCRAAAPHESRL